MLNIQTNFNLRTLNTFGLETDAAYFTELKSVQDIDLIAQHELYHTQEILVLGGGSNLLFTQPYVDKWVIKNEIKGIEILQETEQEIIIKVGAGEIWHHFVMYCIENNFPGIENLALIPGSVGAAPMQNIGAYGVEVKDVIDYIEAWHITDKKWITIHHHEANFGYRTSIFKTDLKNKVIITNVVFRFKKNNPLNTSYGAIQQVLAEHEIAQPAIKDIANAVMQIRRSKLPDPNLIGNAGSFFKNPVITILQFEKLKNYYPQIPSFPIDENQIKIPAAWLIEQCGWKGWREGNYGVHQHQALVLVNYGGASGNDISRLAQRIIESVQEKFGIPLEQEVNFE